MLPNGHFKIVDRKKDMILVSGFNVFPNEIEDWVCQHPGITECAAIGIPNVKTQEAPKIYVVKTDESLTKEDVMKWCEEGLTRYKLPREIDFRDELPKTNVGKIRRADLRAEYAASVKGNEPSGEQKKEGQEGQGEQGQKEESPEE